MTSTILHGNCLDVLKTMPDNSVHMAVTSPPYWGLRAYGTEGQVWPDGWIGELGHEPTPQLYVAHLVQIMREVRRVLRDDGTLWLNIGDSYFGDSPTRSKSSESFSETWDKTQTRSRGGLRRSAASVDGLKPKDLVGIPWRVAFALQDDGWWLRQDIIWAKPNPMPESVTDRCTKAHEYMFLLAKSARYYYDAEAVKEPNSETSGKWGKSVPSKTAKAQGDGRHGDSSFLSSQLSHEEVIDKYYTNGRNRRSVWTITTKPFRDAHFAVFPPDLVEPCIKAGTSQHGVCTTCGAPWERFVERGESTYAKIVNEQNITHEDMRKESIKRGVAFKSGGADGWGGTRNSNGTAPHLEAAPVKTMGWRPTCACNADTTPSIVLDPFNGAGTTGVVAKSLGRNYIGIELNPAYVEMAQRRIDKTQPPLL